MIVVDTNIIAYLYLPGPYTPAAEALFLSDPDWAAPLLWRSELRNILSTYVRKALLSLEDAYRIQREAEALMAEREYDVDSLDVLKLAKDSGCTAYDCEFVALAYRLGATLVTQDAKLRQAFVNHTRALARI
ncbi:MAG: PIN domain-containing protein [Hydrogenophaga sp.]|uniref:type II toxin-antitoxin system VapC family toxin n=1 Tax=Hydrogenophaga sp. TaxID=1904254 RepID=UPI00169D83B9|nr:type II toxin-antitoxin system VapC family toxin [Hydrogenophaga sp.]NIM41670.1 PIN domain-containing protein [Hydrogenophaga sp.]NIN26975.1 PIN domain-containing protein [Hydrogenophaga sp.]NIN31676.1 PIN domain-containing protein [Hydrogenophaga sp.]NIN55920.1 PIN domain-containing protein [Hydrogenophaga sp.]NIO52047.1 PIN domain-containing protein [Hydrogenophaga sp.]